MDAWSFCFRSESINNAVISSRQPLSLQNKTFQSHPRATTLVTKNARKAAKYIAPAKMINPLYPPPPCKMAPAMSMPVNAAKLLSENVVPLILSF